MNRTSSFQPTTFGWPTRSFSLLGGFLALVSVACVSGPSNPFRDADSRIEPALVELMQRARANDQLVDFGSPLFAAENLRLGTWKPDLFDAAYGTALFTGAHYDATRTPLFLVHGIGGSPREFAALADALKDSRYQPVFFFYPSGLAIPEAGRALEARMREFMSRHDVSEFALVAHSMGGLVSKTMLDRLDGDWLHCQVFVSIASPWAGVSSAWLGDMLPGHPRSWSDLVPNSETIQGLHETPFPEATSAYLLFGDKGGNAPFTTGNDGSVAVDSALAPAITEQMDGVFGFYEDHASILSARAALTQLRQILNSPERHNEDS